MPINSFLEYLSYEKKYSQHTVMAYKNDLISFESFCLVEYDDANLLDANYSQIRSWIVSLVDSGISNRTVNRKISSLRAFYRFNLKAKQINENPLVKHKALKTSKKIQVPFSEKEIFQVIDEIITTDSFELLRDKLIVELLYSTGMRRAELIDLKLADVDLSSNMIKVLGKRNKERYIPLLGSVVKSLKIYIEARDKEVQGKPQLFFTSKGKKLYPSFVYRIINDYFSKISSKVKKSPHVLRHSFATHLLSEGADLNSVKELLGHSSLASTQVYTHSNMGQLKQVYNQAHPRSRKKR